MLIVYFLEQLILYLFKRTVQAIKFLKLLKIEVEKLLIVVEHCE